MPTEWTGRDSVPVATQLDRELAIVMGPANETALGSFYGLIHLIGGLVLPSTQSVDERTLTLGGGQNAPTGSWEGFP